ncbi:restriction endonuclease PLD domain-containing protein [Flavobacterium psychrotrophum]|uniref:restriction endonuclease PLD domain-containing protein n=1 Tax=Flavobacterium psychrotrophum TaxID=2294119 RepID=UPI000E321B83|nr:restriction endonuclease PLD domain-containing protein [Flavobacterium psychrotrophum]
MIVNNLTSKNHHFHIVELFKDAVEVTVISPFITQFSDLMPFETFRNLKHITFVTTMMGYDRFQYSKVRYLKSLYDKLRHSGVTITILIENSLHGKIYIADYTDGSLKAIVTSANFTRLGLMKNNEWGNALSNKDDILKIKEGISNKVLHEPVGESFIDECLLKIKENPMPDQPYCGIELNLESLLKLKRQPIGVSESATFWLKPIGVSSNPIPTDWNYDRTEDKMHFARNPAGVKKNDILICYAVGHLNLLAAYRVSSESDNTKLPDDRWPYFVFAENLTPVYGGNWAAANLTISQQRLNVLNKKLFDITPSGKIRSAA